MNAFEDMGHEDKTDRDLLIEIRRDLKHLCESYEELKRDHELRLRTVEQNAWKQSGAFGVIGVLLSAFVAWLVSVFSGGR